ncbi:hypothetical protein AWM70_20260 [Paenibacillus yonginensis]|uniref:Glycosyltransferase RgtA/B/C/D-like domain-containing protein n=1 Tax=Paenibacillus yonginensis TaxID=1462996 RepID=A0A1B1N5B5_9BACL|nr:glycosyltransferase family 39 protein [Paenibacillus yonginensis]ANS76623.1 hypothetical protein AWM70_20260 [Paenibacillus yonginensis]
MPEALQTSKLSSTLKWTFILSLVLCIFSLAGFAFTHHADGNGGFHRSGWQQNGTGGTEGFRSEPSRWNPDEFSRAFLGASGFGETNGGQESRGSSGGRLRPGDGRGFEGGGLGSMGGGRMSQIPLAEPIALAAYTALAAVLIGIGWRRLRSAQPALLAWDSGEGEAANRRHSGRSTLWLMLGSALLLRIALVPWTTGHNGDMNYFRSWATSAAQDFSGFYVHGSADYPPLLIYFLYLIGRAASLPGMEIFFNTMIKLPSLLADVITGYLIYRLASRHVSTRLGFILAAFYAACPAVLVDSAFWGQVDSFFTLLIVLAVLLITEGRLTWSAALFAAAVMMKPQGIIFAPVLFFEWVRLRSVKKAAAGMLTAAAVVVLLILPFSSGQDPLWIVKLFQRTIGEYPYASVNADNFFSLIGANHKDSSSVFILFSYQTWGWIFIVLTTAYSWLIYSRIRSREAAFLAALFQIAGVFTFSTSMHERYLFPAVALAICAYLYFKDKRLLGVAAGFSFTVFANTFSVLYGATGRTGTPSYTYSLMFVSLINVLLVLWLAVIMWQLAFRTSRE